MLILNRKVGEEIRAGPVVIKILRISRTRVKVGVTAPPEVRITYHEATDEAGTGDDSDGFADGILSQGK